ncbi:MAG: AIPR family protein [Alphaproteobacteria bacterium]|nr:AIPR family protein [Alphaproteobacteria bacterium]MBU1512492.1 AIPR family protein [Alphaproteobacteria bacterium]MBU2307316.1 AIPR family protein [Alphaproteobacteria bacterium]MBU2362536.1 AIPR family protein [Alphaproteobacteria bacterium]
MLEVLSDQVGIVENATSTYFEGVVERGRSKINGYAISDDEDALDLFVSIFLNAAEPEKVAPDDVRKAIEQAVRYFRGAVGGLHRSLEPASDRYAMTARIAEVGRRISRVRIFVLTDGVTGLERTRLPSRTVGDVELRFEVWDMERLSRAVAYGRPQAEIVVDLEDLGGAIPCVTLPDPDADYSAYLMIVPGQVLYRLYELYGSQLLERNVRSFLQAKGKVNRGIRDSLRNEPHRFMAYNNGISMTAESVETTVLPGGQPAVQRIRGLQIVNGGQTSSSIHRAAKQDKADLSGVYVQAKLTVVGPELLDTLAPRIAEFANTQNPIQMADFSANDPYHIEIERLANQIWIPGEQGRWFYERARGQYLVAQASEARTEAQARQFKERTPPHRKITKMDLSKFINAWDQLPHQVCLGGQKNFVLFMQRLRETRARSWKPDDAYFRDLVAKAVLFGETARIVRKEGFEGYRSQIVAYTISALAFRSGDMLDLGMIWQEQRISTALEDLIRTWSHEIGAALITSAGTRNVGEWCKKADCWKAVRMAALALPAEPPPEFARTVRSGGSWGVAPTEDRVALTPDELDAMRQCQTLEAGDWIRIVEWGARTGRLDAREREIASEMGAMAAGGWGSGRLTPKRALRARSVIVAALEGGALEAEPAA